MDEPTSSSSLLPGLGNLVDVSAKIGAALGLFALGSAFLYDFVFWSRIDLRVIFYYAFADHVETAIVAVGTTLLFAVYGTTSLVGGWLFGGWLVRRPWLKWQKVLWGVVVLFVWAMATSAAAFSLASGRLVLLPPAVATLCAFIIPAAGCMSAVTGLVASPLFRFGPYMIVLIWVVTVCAAALARADSRPISYTDTITLAGFNSASGRILRILDKGVILRGVDGRIIFIPKDQVLRVDQRVPQP